MISLQALKERFAKDPVPLRWGGIASDLLRISSMAHAERLDVPAFRDVLNETKLFTEWIAPDVEPEAQTTILSLQRSLATWSPGGSLPAADLEEQAREWSEKILDLSGLAA